jgi:hypothetical protein
VAVRVMEGTQIQSFESHLDLALAMEPDELEAVRALAAQLKGMKILPILGAGASHDCGMRVAGDIATDLHADCCVDEGLRASVQGIAPDDLGGIAEAIYTNHGNNHQAVLEAIGMPDPHQWPGAPEVDPHFCALRLLARAAREHKGLGSAFSFNYDCCKEAALRAEGFSWSRERTAGLVWVDNVNVFCNKEMYVDPHISSGFELIKIHGCAEHYREAYKENECEEVAEAVVIRAKQIETWEERLWAKRSLAEGVQKSVLLLVGFSGQDQATATELKAVLEDICSSAPDPTPPRLVVIDHNPDTDALQELIDYGVSPEGTGDGAVTKVCTANSSTTAVLMVLLAEMIALELEPALTELGFTLSLEPDERLGLLALAGPAMARWSFLLGKGSEAYMQRISAGMEGHDYVPLSYEPPLAVRAFKIREELREVIGRTGPERASDLADTDGFILHSGCAYLPLGIDLDQVKTAHRSGLLEQAKDVLPKPEGVELILVCEDGGVRKGFSLARGQEVPVP